MFDPTLYQKLLSTYKYRGNQPSRRQKRRWRQTDPYIAKEMSVYGCNKDENDDVRRELEVKFAKLNLFGLDLPIAKEHAKQMMKYTFVNVEQDRT